MDEKPKLSAAAAQAAISEAMQAAESQNPAADPAEPRDAGQGDIPSRQRSDVAHRVTQDASQAS